MLKQYMFYANGVLRLYFHDGYRDVRLSENFGKIVWRYKLRGTIKHTGIELGHCMHTGLMLYIHNHPRQGRASIVSAEEFAQRQTVYYENGPCVNTPQQVIEVGLNAVIQRVAYRVAKSNCQNLTNKACKNVSYSQDFNKYAGLAAVFVGFLTILGIGVAASD